MKKWTNQIWRWDTDEVIAKSEILSVRDLVVHHRENLSHAQLTGTRLAGIDFRSADLRFACFAHADLDGCDFRHVNLEGVSFVGARLRGANFLGANLYGASFLNADLTGARWSGANLLYADVSGAAGLLSASDWLTANFDCDDLGVLVFRRVGTTWVKSPAGWDIRPGAFLTDNPCGNRTIVGNSGVYFGTLNLCSRIFPDADLWRCRIRWIDLADVVVSYEAEKLEEARCGRLELLEIVVPAVRKVAANRNLQLPT